MSILSDLDPKNARFDDDAANAGAGKMSWGAPLALFVVAGLGLAAAVYHGGGERFTSTSAKAAVPPIVKVATPQPSVVPLPITPTAADKPVMIEPARISPPVVDAKPQELAVQGSKKKTEAGMQAQQQAQKNQADKKKLASNNDTKKTQKQDKTIKTARKDKSKPAARDVEIITAIVK